MDGLQIRITRCIVIGRLSKQQQDIRRGNSLTPQTFALLPKKLLQTQKVAQKLPSTIGPCLFPFSGHAQSGHAYSHLAREYRLLRRLNLSLIPLVAKAMSVLHAGKRDNMIYNAARCFGEQRHGDVGPIMPLDRMPFIAVKYKCCYTTNSDKV